MKPNSWLYLFDIRDFYGMDRMVLTAYKSTLISQLFDQYFIVGFIE
ncbi:hypothetical protein PBL1C_76 [Paenibacillus phage PBL1c]|uniref:Uncharacterized protein n=1 Tax=Paenibacillus phage PBL1c TaxID=2070194 RepID=A0A2I7SCC1_9CAUD|nr:hypothetical protein HWB44_gp76 [Paenibacillus phage PBL1c]AUS03553.1 hypothetical protein PBL1C_76 [Paenibacillus phage PBL1c]